MAACGMDPSGRGCSVTDCRPSDAVETLTTSPVTNVTVANNRWGRHYRYGPYAAVTPDANWDYATNVWDDTGEPVRAPR